MYSNGVFSLNWMIFWQQEPDVFKWRFQFELDDILAARTRGMQMGFSVSVGYFGSKNQTYSNDKWVFQFQLHNVLAARTRCIQMVFQFQLHDVLAARTRCI